MSRFADQSETAKRLTDRPPGGLPAHGQVNPYASPAGVGGYAPDLDRGVGVWRDGDRVVIHKEVELPRICLITGEPARFGYPLEIVWRQGAEISTRRLRLNAPLSAAIHRSYRRRRWAAIGGFLASVGWLSFAIFLHEIVGQRVVSLSIGLTAFVAAAAFFTYCYYSQLLYFVAASGSYLWLKGADRRFLARLPPWSA
jgi:hypothetical protein